jgi:hypothetical protein
MLMAKFSRKTSVMGSQKVRYTVGFWQEERCGAARAIVAEIPSATSDNFISTTVLRVRFRGSENIRKSCVL